DVVGGEDVDEEPLGDAERPAAVGVDHLAHQAVVLIDEDAAFAAGGDEAIDAAEAFAGRGRVVQDADRDDAVERGIGEGKLVEVGVDKADVWAIAEMVPDEAQGGHAEIDANDAAAGGGDG